MFFLIGPPACGKTFWRKNYLAKSLRPTIVISNDDLIEEWAIQNAVTYTEAFHACNLHDIEQQTMQTFRIALKNNDDIIIDRTNMTDKTRSKFLSQIPKNYQRYAIIFEISRFELQSRLDKRCGKIIPVEAIDNFISNYIPPTKAEFNVIEKIIFK